MTGGSSLAGAQEKMNRRPKISFAAGS